jgi:hypothetical protein
MTRWAKTGGAGRDRTGDLLNANQALSQLSYSPLPLPEGRKKSIEADWTRTARTTCIRASKSSSQLFKWRCQRHHGVERLPLTPQNRNRFRFSSVTPPTFSLRKEVIQPQVLLRLPCYDFTPIMNHTLDRCPPCESAGRLLVQFTFVM